MAKEDNQIDELSSLLNEMNDLLDKILHAQFGIEDKQWVNAMRKIEEGFIEAVNFIAKKKGIGISKFVSEEEIDRILES